MAFSIRKAWGWKDEMSLKNWILLMQKMNEANCRDLKCAYDVWNIDA